MQIVELLDERHERMDAAKSPRPVVLVVIQPADRGEVLMDERCEIPFECLA